MLKFHTEKEEKNFTEYYQKLPPDLIKKEDNYKEHSEASGRSKRTRVYPIFQMVDALMLPAKEHIACQKECSHCCQKPVSITQQEANYIAFKEGLTVAEESFEFFPKQDTAGLCPFLKNNLCSIYDNRPYNCRRKVQFDSKDRCEQNLESAEIYWTGLEMTLMDISDFKVSDIRHAFKIKK